jgi:hypothetical protein
VQDKVQQQRGKREDSCPAVRSQLLLPVPVWSKANQKEEEQAKASGKVKLFKFSRAQGRSSSYAFSHIQLSDMQA